MRWTIAAAASLLTGCALLSAHAADSSRGLRTTGMNPVSLAEPLPAEPPVMELNPTSRVVDIHVPLKMDGFMLGEVPVRITVDDVLSVDVAMLSMHLKNVLKPEVLAAVLPHDGAPGNESAGISVAGKRQPGETASSVVRLAASKDAVSPTAAEDRTSGSDAKNTPGYLPLNAIRERGLIVEYDPQALELAVKPGIGQRPTMNISLAPAASTASSVVETPSAVSAYLNMRLTAAYVSQAGFSGSGDGAELPSFDFDGALRLGGLVIEGEGTFSHAYGGHFGETGIGDYVFHRRGTRLVYDLPEDAIRLRAGDLAPAFSGFQSAPEILGLSAEKSYAELQPGRTVRPAGQRSFRIERPSNVDILIEGVVVRRLRLSPGTYNAADLPLQTGANDISIVIEEDTGARQTLEFTAFSAQDLLAPGLSEWSIAAGVKSIDRGYHHDADGAGSFYSQPDYETGEPVATAFYRAGVLPAMTAEVNLQADADVLTGGAGIVTQTPLGLFSFDAASSMVHGEGAGFALQGAYASAPFALMDHYPATLRILGEYQTPDFAVVGDTSPVRDYGVVLSASYSQRLPFDLSAGLSVSYFLAREDDLADRWSADLTVSKRLAPALSASLAMGYADDGAAERTCCGLDDDGFRSFLRLSYTPDSRSSVLISHDTRTQGSRAAYSRSSGTSGPGSWNASIEAARDSDEDGGVSGALFYAGNRADVSVSHAARLSGTTRNGGFVPEADSQRTSVQIASSLVYADGILAIGRPVSGGFAIVAPHDSLQGADVVIGTQNAAIARSDWLGPAVVSSVGAYTPARFAYDVPDAPAGYDLGRLSYDLVAPYKAGYSLKAGSAYTVTAIGTLTGSDGAPVALASGTARRKDAEGGPAVELFTNRAGRFGAQGLAPGPWLIDVPQDAGEVLHFALLVPDGTSGIYSAGVLKPSVASGAAP